MYTIPAQLAYCCRQDQTGTFVPMQTIPNPGEPWYNTSQECQGVCDIFNLKEEQNR